jgi:transposase
MICKLPCCLSPVKQAPRAVKRAKTLREKKYRLPYPSTEERHSMSVLKSIGKTRNEVAEILKCSTRTVQWQMKKYKQSETFLDKPKTGRPTNLTPEISDQILLGRSRQKEYCTPTQIDGVGKIRY